MATILSGIDFSQESLISLLKIIAIDIVLSGDNAVVIAMATKGLPKKLQNKAIIIGTGGAVILRIIFAIVIVYLLQIPFVHLVGGLLLLWIAYHVLVDNEPDADVKSQGTLTKAIWTIIGADAVMSLDNVVAIAGAANGHIGMIALGVLISIPIMIFGSKLIVRLMDKYKWISYVGAGILAWTAGQMITGDKFVINWLDLNNGPFMYTIITALTLLLLLIGYMRNKKIAE